VLSTGIPSLLPSVHKDIKTSLDDIILSEEYMGTPLNDIILSEEDIRTPLDDIILSEEDTETLGIPDAIGIFEDSTWIVDDLSSQNSISSMQKFSTNVMLSSTMNPLVTISVSNFVYQSLMTSNMITQLNSIAPRMNVASSALSSLSKSSNPPS
jgi:hypothetical protein